MPTVRRIPNPEDATDDTPRQTMLPLGTPGNAGRPNGTVLGFEKKLWELADKLRSNMDAAEYKHVVLGLIFLKYISDVFEEKHRALLLELDLGANPEDPDEYRAENIFWVPEKARGSTCRRTQSSRTSAFASTTR
jgi:hypothetical protein